MGQANVFYRTFQKSSSLRSTIQKNAGACSGAERAARGNTSGWRGLFIADIETGRGWDVIGGGRVEGLAHLSR